VNRALRSALLASALVALALGPTACGDDGAGPTATTVTSGDLTVSRAFAGSYGATTAAAYLTITNSGAEDALLSVTSPGATAVEPMGGMAADGTGDGVGRAEGGTPIPADGTVAFTPGGTHLMVEGLAAPVAAGDTLRLRLEFEHAPALEVEASVVDVADIPDLMAGE
jgi:copper(I)-binding protein